MPDSIVQDLTANSISGCVILKESSVGIPNLLMVLTSTLPDTPVSAAPPSAAAPGIDWRSSVITGPDGSFGVTYNDGDFRLINPKEMRPDLHLSVLAPEEPGVNPQDLLLFATILPRQNAGRVEQYIIRLATGTLVKAGILVPSEISQDLEPAQNVVGRLNALAARQSSLVDGAIGAAKKLVESHRNRVSSFHANFKPSLISNLSRLPSEPLNPGRYVGEGDSVFSNGEATIQEGIQNTVNSDDPAKRAPGLVTSR